MKTTKIRLLLFTVLVVIFNTGCMKMAIKKYQIGRKFTVQKQGEYLKQISKENNFDSSHLLYLDSASYGNFVFANPSATIYYGSFVNDSISIKKNDFLLDNQSCIGRIESDIDKIISDNRIDTLAKDTLINLDQLTFLRLSDNQPVKIIDKNKKLTIVLNYFYSFGTYYKSLYREVENVRKKHDKECAVYIVSLDPIYIQHLKINLPAN